MDKETRNEIQQATQAARKLLKKDFADQLAGDFDVHLSGKVESKAGKHLSERQKFQRERIIAAIEHKRGAGLSAEESVADYLRDAAFTTLNRFVALKMLEARDLVQQCITRGEQSSGYREFCGAASGVTLLPDNAGYRLYIECLFDELSTEIKVLFDRRDPSSVLWPNRATVEGLLQILNADSIKGVWGEDETIGWVYQFFNGQDERRKMREESQAPRNSRELAIRNQFFTPRYVVQFLTDNTLGRIWYEMRDAKTMLAERCEYMVRKPGEEWASRAKKDPRDLRVLDPACGSGHFLLYAFDLLLAIYEEAWADPESPKSEATGETLAIDYPSLGALRKVIPAIVLAHNLHGVDIDPRCAQIAQLALWMRAQKAYRDFGIGRAERGQIRRSNIVVAEPLVADDQIAQEFLAKLGDAELGRVFTSLVASLNLAGDLGLLLRVEKLVKATRLQGELFAPPEERIRAALDGLVREEANATNTRRRIFADDAAHGVALLGVAEKKFDTVLMNPPFGAGSSRAKKELEGSYPRSNQDIAAAFVERGIELAADTGSVGVIMTRLPFFVGGFADWREEILLRESSPVAFADLGYGVLDGALVEVAAAVFGKPTRDAAGWFGSALRSASKPAAVLGAIRRTHTGAETTDFFYAPPSSFRLVGGSPFCYWISPQTRAALYSLPSLEQQSWSAKKGLDTADDVRFLRAAWEVHPDRLGTGQRWMSIAKGGEYNPLYDDIHLAVDWLKEGEPLRIAGASIRNSQFYGRPGVTYSSRSTSGFNAKVLPSGAAISTGGHGVFGDPQHLHGVLALMLSRSALLQIELAVGGGDEAHSGSAARNYLNGIVSRLHAPDLAQLRAKDIVDPLMILLASAMRRASHDETARNFVAPRILWHQASTLTDAVKAQRSASLASIAAELAAYARLDSEMSRQLGLDSRAIADLDDQLGALIGDPAFATNTLSEERYVAIADLDIPELISQAANELGAARFLSKKAYVADRRFELLCRLLRCAPGELVELERARAVSPKELEDAVSELTSIAVGSAFGRWRASVLGNPSAYYQGIDKVSPWDVLNSDHSHAKMWLSLTERILVDDPGHPDDIVSATREAFLSFWAASGEDVWDEIERFLISTLGGESARAWLSGRFFSEHMTRYSKSRKTAPIYWQLATPSASYSVWLYIHAFSKDTLFRVQNDHVMRKLGLEERRLSSMTLEYRDNATAAQRKELAKQEEFVGELRAFLEEVTRVAPMWNPSLDDGVIINFAPLWRLVPQNKSWQKELKSTWDALCEGKYDWAHLAMHLWPERVVPECADDRSLAIAHGLEEVFWVEGSDGKWSKRKAPTRSIDELIRERASTAVKASLKSLREAPVVENSGRRRGRQAAVE